MPVYQYACPECEQGFEKRQSFHDDPLNECEYCGSSQVRRVINPVGIVFKGSGFYINDSKANGKGKALKNGKDGSKTNGKVNGDSSSTKTTETSATTEKSTKTEKTDAKPTKETSKSKT